MENPSSPLDTLRQLKEMLDAGALTPTEFEALKQRLVFTPSPASAEPAAAPATPVASPLPAPEAAATNAPAPPPASPPAFPSAGPFGSQPAPHEVEVEALVFEPVAEPMFMPEASADFPIAVGGPSYVEAETLADNGATDPAGAPAERNSSLGLVLAIGAVLVFLAVVAYLGFTRPASEHISSTSKTAADSLATTIETGPQVAPLSTTTAAPETVRVAPTNPAPVIQPRPAAAVADSVAPATNPPIPDSAGNRRKQN